jgi:hypothetical protein
MGGDQGECMSDYFLSAMIDHQTKQFFRVFDDDLTQNPGSLCK